MVEKQEVAGAGAGAVASIAATKGVLAAVGFSKAGVVAGSFAATIQTPATVAGGWFATCQAAGATGIAALGAGPLIGVAAAGAAGGYGVYKGYQYVSTHPEKIQEAYSFVSSQAGQLYHKIAPVRPINSNEQVMSKL
eukprot:TRINITY_DN2372_c0_g1_i1.p1 TRINITY_DN2372_c0_g1~~TRINITY_DN2372_c0_g1_i1.p1  ORF type:complete len:137 (-),score=53.36 TRINITY_DN2372_c0_g1_i1:100-510(-)